MARLFDGVDDRVRNTGGAALASSNGPFTVMCWFKPANLTQTNTYVLLNGPIATAEWSFVWEYTDNLFEFFSAGYVGSDPRTGVTIPDTAWHHVAFRKAASGASEWAKFLDGGKTIVSASIDFTLPNSNGDLTIGAAQTSNYVNATIAEVRIYDAALSDDEISAAMRGSVPRPGALVRYYPLWGAAAPEPDLSGNARNGTVTGAVLADHAPIGPYTPSDIGLWYRAFVPPIDPGIIPIVRRTTPHILTQLYSDFVSDYEADLN